MHTFDASAPLFLSVSLMLLSAATLGEIARKLHQPAVLGEIIAGIILGPTVLGYISPEAVTWLFPAQGHTNAMLDGITSLSIALFLLVAGMEVEFTSIIKARKIATYTAIGGLVFPFVFGYLGAYFFPTEFGSTGRYGSVFALFIATAMSISALPVIARTLMDLNLYRSEMGMITIAAAVLNDIIGWMIFAVIMALLGIGDKTTPDIIRTLIMTVFFAIFMLTIARTILNKLLVRVQAYLSWPAGTLSFILIVTFACAAIAEMIGIHAIFGSFLAGVALGDSKYLSENTREKISDLVSFVFAPLFFASIGLKVNLIANFDFGLTLIIVVIAFSGKILGSGFAAKLSGITGRESVAIGVAMNARGAMEIILALLALQAGIINDKIFVSLLVMAMLTSLLCGPMIRKILNLKPGKRFASFLSEKYFLNNLKANTPFQAIKEIASLFDISGIDNNAITAALIEREELMSTGLGSKIAIPHARLKGLSKPVIGVGISDDGIDFNSPDGKKSNVVIVILVPESDNAMLLNLFAEISEKFKNTNLCDKLMENKSYIPFLSTIRTMPD